jgi:tetratricopeptide (TPR) repeat protein
VKHKARLLGLVLAPARAGATAWWYRAHSLQARLARALPGTPQAGAVLRQLARAYPDHAEVQFRLAQQLRLEGRNDQVQLALNRAADLGWYWPQLEREQLLLLSRRDFPQAEPRLQQLRDVDPQDREVLLALAAGFAEMRYLAKAEVLVNAVLDRDPDDSAALCVRGRVKLARQQFALAREDIDRAFRRGPDDASFATARFLLGCCLLDLGQFEESIRLLQECQAEDPDDPRVPYNLGRCHVCLAGRDAGRRDAHQQAALDAFERACQLRPRDVATLLQLAEVHEDRGEFPEALVLLEQAEQQAPDLGEIAFRMAKTLRALGRHERAAGYQKRVEALQKAVDRRSDSIP